MTKYSPKFKAEIIGRYLNENLSSVQLEKLYGIHRRQIRSWIQAYRLQGKVQFSHQHHRFDADFKFSVIDYYQTHEESLAEVAANFDILPSQISAWRSAFERDGYEALKPHWKGRPPKTMKSKKKATSSKLSSMN